ncbi:MAG: tyrosine-type recombinase/integrase [Bryobacterales bacterium]|nr:tyrosine-type recombinase/integrase [Bryobacterales bacterium]
MNDLLTAAKKERDEKWPDSPWVFNRQGEQIKDFRWAWEQTCKRAGVPELKFHDLRRTAVRNMRRDGVPQVVRMKISGHKRIPWNAAITSWIPTISRLPSP